MHTDQSDEEIWTDQQKDNDKDKYSEKDNDNDNWRTPAQNRLVTFETLITFLTIENNNLNIHSDPSIKSDRDSIHNSFLWFQPLFFEFFRVMVKYNFVG